jgi:uncharacterized YigZ family protein
MKNYLTIEKKNEITIDIKKSKFIAQSYPVTTQEEITEILEECRKKHYKSTHVTYAYVFGKNMEKQKASDDGEPSGTAGKPILDVILNKKLTNILVIVIRYFGGTKLGASGLIRAYSQSASDVINEDNIVLQQYSSLIDIIIDYTLQASLDNSLRKKDYFPYKIEYTETVKMSYIVSYDEEEAFIALVREKTNDRFKYDIAENTYIKTPINK